MALAAKVFTHEECFEGETRPVETERDGDEIAIHAPTDEQGFPAASLYLTRRDAIDLGNELIAKALE